MSSIQAFLNIDIHTGPVPFEVLEQRSFDDYGRQLIRYTGSERDEIRAYLFTPNKQPVLGSILVHHQHSGERHLGKSEVAGLVGDPYQFFCPALASRGFVCLAPDSICFEDRRSNMQGIEQALDPDEDWLQHYNEMCYRLVQGKTLMKKVIEDSSIAVSLLAGLPEAIPGKLGTLGHSYGGNTVLFHSPLDDRIAYACSSGAVCSYKRKLEDQIGIEMAEVIPGFAEKFDIIDLLKEIVPRKLLILSADQDKYTRDAGDIFLELESYVAEQKYGGCAYHLAFQGKHGLDQERFEAILDWFTEQMER